MGVGVREKRGDKGGGDAERGFEVVLGIEGGIYGEGISGGCSRGCRGCRYLFRPRARGLFRL